MCVNFFKVSSFDYLMQGLLDLRILSHHNVSSCVWSVNKRVNVTSDLPLQNLLTLELPMLQGRRFQVHSFERDVQALNGHNSRYTARRNT